MNLLDDSLWIRFEKNIAVLKEFRPHVFEKLESEINQLRESPHGNETERLVFFADENKNLNLLYENKDSNFRTALHSSNPQDEVKQIITQAKLDYHQIVFFFGQGLGHLLRHFADNRPTTNSAMVLIEPNTQIFLRSLFVYDWGDLFKENRFFLILENDHETARRQIGSVFSELTTVSRNLKILANPGSLKITPQFFHEIGKEILESRDLTTILVGNSIEDSFIGFENVMDNIGFAIQNSGIGPLKDKFSGKTIVSVAAGPSVEENWETIKAIQGKIPIVTCDVLLRPMLERGIVPDLVCAIERVPIVTEFFRGVPCPEQSMLVGPLLLLKETFDAYQGPKIAYCPVVQSSAGLGLDFLHAMNPGSSAGNVNLAIAAFLGFKNIIMVGHNLAYGLESRTSHFRGTGYIDRETPLSEEELIKKSGGEKVVTQDGKDEVYTSLFWQTFRAQIEGLISFKSDRRWINTAPKGAKIAGAELLSLNEALGEIKPQPISFFEERKKWIGPISAEVQTERKTSILENLTASEERMSFWLKESEKILKKLTHWKEKIEAKEKSGKKLSIEYLDKALDEVLNIKVKAVNEDPVFNNAVISIISPAHITFERMINIMPNDYTDNYSLKRDVLLEHIKYFSIWNRWIPKILSKTVEAIDHLKKFSVA